MPGRGHEAVQSDRGAGPIFAVELHHGVHIAVVRMMGGRRELLGARRARDRDDGEMQLALLRARLALHQGPTLQVLEEWVIQGLVEGGG